MAQDDPLLTAFVDGVGELTPDERRRIEAHLADDPTARTDAAAMRELLGALRALPAEGEAPDWAALERQIRAAVAPLPVRPWWRRWRFVVPFGAFVAATAVFAIWLGERAPAVAKPEVAHLAPAPAPAAAAVAPARPSAPSAADLVWLDDRTIDVGDLDPDAVFGDLDRQVHDAMAQDTADVGDGILPAVDLGLVDTLDDSQLDAAARALAAAPTAGGKG